MAVSQNGWEVITTFDSHQLRLWTIPNTMIQLRLRTGPAGFVMTHVATWYHRQVEALTAIADEHAYSYRVIQGSVEWSNHASGTAIDLNSLQHPQGQSPLVSFSTEQLTLIHTALSTKYQSKVKWGGDFHTTVDGMHWEINTDYDGAKVLALDLKDTSAGKLVLRDNPVAWKKW
jgi:hypothetical protein